PTLFRSEVDARSRQSILFVSRLDGHPIALVVEGGELGQRGYHRQVLAALYCLDVFQYLGFAEHQISVSEAIFVEGAGLGVLTRVDPVGQTIEQGLTGKAVDHGLDGMGLVGLGFKLQLHDSLFLHAFCMLSARLSARSCAERTWVRSTPRIFFALALG